MDSLGSQSWKEVRQELYNNHGFTARHLDEVEEVFRGDRGDSDQSSSSSFPGLSKQEAEAGIKWLEENRSRHQLPPAKVEALKQTLKSKLNF